MADAKKTDVRACAVNTSNAARDFSAALAAVRPVYSPEGGPTYMATTSKVADFAPWEPLSEDVNSDRRREKRKNLAFSVELFGFNIANDYFTERGVTVNVSPAGCQLRLKNQVDVKSVLAL